MGGIGRLLWSGILLCLCTDHALGFIGTPLRATPSLPLSGSRAVAASSLQRQRLARGGVAVRMSDKDELSDKEEVWVSNNDDLWVSLRNRVGSLPTADVQSHMDVVELVMQSLMSNDDPFENHGIEMLHAYSSHLAKENDPASFLSAEALTKSIKENPDTQFLLGAKDFKVVDSREITIMRHIIFRVSVECEDGQWRTTCFTLSRVGIIGSRWLIDSIGRSGLV